MWVTSINIVSSKERGEKKIVEHLQEFVPAQKGILRRLFKDCFLLWYNVYNGHSRTYSRGEFIFWNVV